EICLDLTHGINYQTILTYRAVKEMAGLLSVFVKEVNFKAYNADPFSRGVTEEISLNLIEETKPEPRPFNERIKQGRVLEPTEEMGEEERRKLFEKDLSYFRGIGKREISAFIGALYNGLPLALFTFYPDREKLREVILRTFEIYESYITVSNAENRLKVTKRVSFGKDFKVCVFSFLIAELLGRKSVLDSAKREVAIEELENLVETIFSFDNRLSLMIDKELRALRDIVNKPYSWDWQLYNKVIEKDQLGEPDKRNFLAHAGFERNIVEIRKGGDNVYLRFLQDRIDTVACMCQEGLK
ncbi:MAG: TIGR01897 family CRISPR-associated protein, partial [Synergistetes bacterium]|nr:TIGR01897 family CRISPR-associated protein [Synergistota bacterium]